MKYIYQIEGMHCNNCVEKIKTVLSPYVKIIQISFDPPQLQIEAQEPPDLQKLNTEIIKAGNYHLHAGKSQAQTLQLGAYYPLFVIATYILGTSLIASVKQGSIDWHSWMNSFMAGFFLVFSAFKFLDLKGFAEGYASYDLLAKRWFTYGLIYPFLELGLGILYLSAFLPTLTAELTIVIMGFSSLGVMNSLLKKQPFQCACLGTLLKIPLSTITLIEDLLMVVLAAFSLYTF